MEDTGTIRFDAEGAFRGLLCRSLVFDDALHLLVAQGSPDTLLQQGSVLSDPSGALWCVYGRKLNFTLDSLPASGTLDAALSNIAAQVNATYGVDRNIVILENRTPIGAILDTAISDDAPNVSFRSLNRSRPPDTEGFALIDGEILSYSGISGNILTGCVRGSAGTTATTHVEYSGDDVFGRCAVK